MPLLNVYDKTGDLLEQHMFDGSLTGWLEKNVDTYRETTRPPYSAFLNGKPWPYVYHNRVLKNEDIIDLTIEPCGAFTIFAIVTIASAAYAYYVASNLETDYQSASEKGQSIYSANARVNSAKPSGVIRETAGQIQIYPDLINPPTRKYENHDEYLYLMLGICSGYIELREEHFYIADTPIINYEGDYVLSIFEPGDTVSGHEAYENWYQTKEVSDLRLTTRSAPKFGVWTAEYSGSTITSRLDGTLEEFPFSVGERFEITSGSNQGYYEVVTINSPNSSAVVIELDRPTGSSTKIETVAQRSRVAPIGTSFVRRGAAVSSSVATTPITRNSFVSAGSPTLTTPSPNQEVVTWESIAGGINWEGPFRLTPENETTRYSEVDIIFPQGLTALDGNNETTSQTVEIAIQWREIGTSAWNTVSSTSYTESTYDQRAYTVTIDYGYAIRPEIRIRRVTQESDDIGTADIVEVKRIKSLLESPASYAGVTTAALKIKGTNALARTSENRINIRGATRKLPTLAELQSGSFDLSASTTDTVTNYNIIGPSLLLAQQYTNIGDSPDYGANPANEHSIDISSDGLTIISSQNNAGKIYTLSAPYSVIGDKTYRGYLTLAGPRPVAARFSSTSFVYDVVKQPDPSPNYFLRLSTLTIPGSGEISSTVDSNFNPNLPSIVGLAVNDEGTKFWIANTSGTIYEYTMSSANDLSTAVAPSPLVTFDASTQLALLSPASNLQSIYLANSEQYLYVLDDNGVVYPYTLGTPGDITTAVYDGAYFESGLTGVKDLVVTSEKMYISTYNSEGFIHEYDLDIYANSRSTRSISRFVGWTLYDAIGDTDTVNWTELDTLDTLWDSRGDYLDVEFSDETTLWEALKIMLAPGYAEPTIKEGKLLPVRIASGTDYSHLYTPDVMLDEGLQVDSVHYDPQEPDGIDVEYFSLTTFENEVIECRATGDTGLRPKRIQAPGITDATKAWRFGMRERNRLRQKPAVYTFQTEMDALNSEYGDPVGIASELFASECGEITAYSAPNITVDFIPSFGAGTHYIAARDRDGAFSGLYTVTQGSPNNTLTITSSPVLDFTPVTDGSMDSSFIAFGDANSWGKRAIIRRITPQSDGTVSVTAEEYVAAVFADDDNAPS